MFCFAKPNVIADVKTFLQPNTSVIIQHYMQHNLLEVDYYDQYQVLAGTQNIHPWSHASTVDLSHSVSDHGDVYWDNVTKTAEYISKQILESRDGKTV